MEPPTKPYRYPFEKRKVECTSRDMGLTLCQTSRTSDLRFLRICSDKFTGGRIIIIIIIIIIRNGTKTISLQTLFGRLNNQGMI